MMKNAVMIVIEDNGKFLLGKRADWKSKAPGYWCPISGHIEPGESEEEAVVREAREELGTVVRPVTKIASIPTNDKTVMLHWWKAEIISGLPRLNNDENSELGWFGKDELKKLQPVFEEDIEIILDSSNP